MVSGRRSSEVVHAPGGAESQRHVLDLIVSRKPPEIVLAAIAEMIQSQRQVRCAVLLPDETGTRIGGAVGPSLPPSLLGGLSRLSLEPPYLTPCGLALRMGRETLIADLRDDQRWSPQWRELAGQHNLRGCACLPVRSADGSILAALLLYREDLDHLPAATDDLLQVASRLIVIALERRQFEARLRTSKQKFATLFHVSPVAMALSGIADGQLREVNEAWSRLTGVPRDEAIGRTSLQLGLIADSGRREQMLADFRRHGMVRDVELPFVTRSGERRTVLVNLEAVSFDGAPCILGINQDITDRKAAEEALRRRMEDLSAVLDAIPIPVNIAHDPECRTITGNRAAHEILRMPRGGNLSFTAPDQERPRHFHCLNNGVEVPGNQLPVQRAARGEVVREEELDIVFEDGAVRRFVLWATPLRGSDGELRGAVASILDMTERRRLEEALREADRRKDQFIATLAHELRNPLAPIRSAVQVLKAKGSPDPDAAWSRDVIDRQVTQMARLLDDLLDVSRISRNKLELRKERVTLSAVLESALETSRPLIDGGGHKLSVSLPTEAIYLDADPLRLAQVFSNLLNNAAKYTERGGAVGVSAEQADGQVIVSVKDTGIGIPSDALPRLFEMFAQATPALERSQGGLGIGLSLAKGLVEMHGGSIEARSDGPGLGSQFFIRLPIAAAPDEPPSADGEDVDLCSAPCKILVADDNRDAADSLALMLRLMGHEVRTAGDGRQAVEVAAAFQPDVALLDIGMPKMNGYEAARLIRAQIAGRSTLLAALTGWGQDEDKRRAFEAGFDRHLTKPIGRAALEKLIASREQRAPSV